MTPTQEQEKSPKDQNEAEIGNETEISNLPNKELKAMIIKMFKELRRRVDGQGEKLELSNKE